MDGLCSDEVAVARAVVTELRAAESCLGRRESASAIPGPVGLNDMDRRRLVDWVISRIGSEYDLAQAWVLGRNLLPLPTRLRSSPNTMANSTARFICCSLLAHAFALVGYPILPVQMRVNPSGAVDQRNLTPRDFEHASVFEVVNQRRVL
jgi:hypothetical protein